MVYCDRSVQDAEEVKMNRIYTVAALALRRYTAVKGVAWGRKRLIEWLQTFSDLYEQYKKQDRKEHAPISAPVSKDKETIVKTEK